jgi:RNA polymerase sigma factor (sigma-70 family)
MSLTFMRQVLSTTDAAVLQLGPLVDGMCDWSRAEDAWRRLTPINQECIRRVSGEDTLGRPAGEHTPEQIVALWQALREREPYMRDLWFHCIYAQAKERVLEARLERCKGTMLAWLRRRRRRLTSYAEDLWQELVSKVHCSTGPDMLEKGSAYLMRMLQNLAADTHNRLRRETGDPVNGCPEAVTAVNDDGDATARRGALAVQDNAVAALDEGFLPEELRKAMKTLPLEERAVMELTLDSFPVREIASQLHVNWRTVLRLRDRAKALLMQQLVGRNGGEA